MKNILRAFSKIWFFFCASLFGTLQQNNLTWKNCYFSCSQICLTLWNSPVAFLFNAHLCKQQRVSCMVALCILNCFTEIVLVGHIFLCEVWREKTQWYIFQKCWSGLVTVGGCKLLRFWPDSFNCSKLTMKLWEEVWNMSSSLNKFLKKAMCLLLEVHAFKQHMIQTLICCFFIIANHACVPQPPLPSNLLQTFCCTNIILALLA